MQIVYLSARPQLLSETLGHIKHFAPFITDVVVITPQAMVAEMSRCSEAWGAPIEVVADEDVLGLSTSKIRSLDHAARNYLLRTAAAALEVINDVFIMSDDDARPLVPIEESWFIDEQGRHRRRYFHSLSGWRHSVTDFDRSLLHSLVILRQRGHANPLSYASHQPQIIDKSLFGAVADEIAVEAGTYPPDEWSPYFVIAGELAPERFAAPEPFTTLGWPQFPGEWTFETVPARHEFENHHPELHEEGGLYDGLATACEPATADATNLEKIFRWHRLERQVRDLAFPDDVDQPWTSDSLGRKLAFKGLHAAKGAYRYVTIDDRSRLAELEGRVRRLEDG